MATLSEIGAGPHDARGRADHRAERVLYVDDDELCRRVFARMLRQRGFTVDLAMGPDEAIAHARRSQYALVVCDLVMPRLDGGQLISRLRAAQENARYLITTAVDPVEATRQLGKTDIDGVIFKPWQLDELVETVERLVQPAHTLPSRRVPAEPTIRGSVLVVDDDPRDRERLGAHLRQALGSGVTLLMAASLSEGLRVAHDQGPIGLALIDLSLPDASGVEAVTEFNHLGLDGPIVVVSGAGDESLAVQAVQAGAQEVVTKAEVEPRSLGRSIRHAVERSRTEKKLTRVALFDQLTGAANRSLFQHRLQSAIARAREHDERFAVFFIDLDHFKSVNDSYGHEVGDALLSAFAMRLSECLGKQDLLARIGGDEFAILSPRVTTREQGEELMRSLREAMASPFELLNHRLIASSSMGMALFPRDGTSDKELMRHADSDMYRAKGAGVRRRTSGFVSKRPPPQPAPQPEMFETALREALEHRQFVLFHQPIVSVATRQVVALEALLRWKRPAHGMVLPQAFLPCLEQTGLIIPVGRWVLSQACRSLRRLRAAVPHLRASVNVTTRQLSERTFVDDVVRNLKLHDLPTSALEIEISESSLTHESVAVLDALRLLQSAGVRLTLDDFGTGTSSLTQLTRVPLTGLKIDRTLIAKLDSPESRATAQAAAAMGRGLSLSVTAEGVETESQYAAICEMGCELAQGRLFAAPTSIEASVLELTR